MVIDRVESLGQVDEYSCTVISLNDGGYDIVMDLERGSGAPMTSSDTRLHSGEGTVGFDMVSNLFVNLAFKDLRDAGWERYRSVAVWV